MANVCFNEITVESTDSEWKEIAFAITNDLVEWSPTYEGPDCDEYDRSIRFSTKWSPRPWLDGQMGAFSKMYPTALFHYHATYEADFPPESTWFCSGADNDKRGAGNYRNQAYRKEVKRFISASQRAADGIFHRVEIMPDGRVAADGDNMFGECNIFAWRNIIKVSCGNWHTVGLTKDGNLVACGSNINGQCDVAGLPYRAVDVSCGRYHTAVLLENGEVMIKGQLEQDVRTIGSGNTRPFSSSDFPVVLENSKSSFIYEYEKLNERIELLSEGDELLVKEGNGSLEVQNLNGETVAYVYYDPAMKRYIKNLKATVEKVRPLSKMRKGSKYAVLEVRLDYVRPGPDKNTKNSAAVGMYDRTPISVWPPVSKIKSVFDAVIGVTESGDILVDGFCPCSEQDIKKIAGAI